MRDRRSKPLYALAVVIFVLMALSLKAVEPTYQKLRESEESVSKGNKSALMVQLPAQFLIASVAGFKEVVAGALWVRADYFFHSGEYHAIMPIVRMVTWLDPHNIDVYTTGAWHLDYNFVDEDQRSDKRYIPASIALLEEGIENNPTTWDLYFELGWTHYNKKLEDCEKALYYMKEACKREGVDPNTGEEVRRPEYVDRMVAHQYEKLGMLDKAVKQWAIARKRIIEATGPGKGIIPDQGSLTVCDRNLGLLYLRMAMRYGDMDAYKHAVEIYKRMAESKDANRDVIADYAAISADYARRIAENLVPGDAKKPLDTKFEVSWKKVKPKVFLLSGKINLIPASEYKDLACEVVTNWYRDNQAKSADIQQAWRDGTRIYWMLADADYKMPELKSFDWKIDTSKTVVWDTAYVSGGTFSQLIDLSKDSEFYPFTAKKYKLTIWVKPQESGVPDYVQDRIGWKGEALVDRNYLAMTPQPDIRMKTPGFRILKKEVILDRSDIM